MTSLPATDRRTRSTARTCAPAWPRRSTPSWPSQRPALDEISDDLAPVAEAIAELLAGGKRLRPAFCYWGWRAPAAPTAPRSSTAATSLELLQACALIHDDVMDGSDTRRGAPAVHRRFGALHRVAGWLGDPEAFGTGAAILLGDLCLVWADEMLSTAAASPPRRCCAPSRSTT